MTVIIEMTTIDEMKMFVISELRSLACHGQMIMTLGWIENITSDVGYKVQLYAIENDARHVIDMDLSSCNAMELNEHCLCRIIGRFYHQEGNDFVKVQSLIVTPLWKYHNFVELVQMQRRFSFQV